MKNTKSKPSEVEYKSDFEKGSSLQQRWFGIGWIELLQRTGNVYYCKEPTDSCYKKLQDLGAIRIRSLMESAKVEKSELPEDLIFYEQDLGLAIDLSSERLKGPFILPPMGQIRNDGIVIGTGTSRIAAELMCATPADQLSFIAYVPAGDQSDLSKFFKTFQKLNNTEEFESIFGLADLDYKIKMEMQENGELQFRNSIISHTSYDFNKDEESPFHNAGTVFLDRVKTVSNDDGQILVEVRCTEKVYELIPKTNKHYKVNIDIQKDDEWHWSYGRFLALTNDRNIRDVKAKIYMLVYDITEPLNLDLVMMWLGRDSVYQTKDLKLAVFTPGRVGSIKEVANFVK